MKKKIFENSNIKKLKLKQKTKRSFGILFTYATALVVVFLFIKFVLPQVVDSISGLINDIPSYINETNKFIDGTLAKLNIDQQYLRIINENFNDLVNYIIKVATNFLPLLGGMLTTVASSIWNIILGIIVSIYLLIDKEKFCALIKKITYAIFPKSASEKILEVSYMSNSIFGKFLIGKIVDSAIIGVLTFFILALCKMPYAILVSVIVGITNIIPFFGPFIGAVPSFIIILFISPVKALWFLVIIFIIQQLDGNIIGPKILGDSIGISAFWILFSILVAGKFLGLIGMVIGVPLFAVIYAIVKEIIEGKLKKKNMNYKTEDYLK